MKAFQDIVKAIGLSPTTTVVRAGPGDCIVYEAVLDSAKTSVTGIRIDVDHKLQGYLDAGTWDPPSGDQGAGLPQDGGAAIAPADSGAGTAPASGKGTGQGEGSAAGHIIRLSCNQAVMTVGKCLFSVACNWSLQIESCSGDGMDLLFGHDSDRVTTWVAQMAYLLLNDLQDYLV
ncbi:MAG: rRNA adenine N-6-methyltransferase family protein [Proteobacteria bacterium]|nr:rRNA adenine N-6-methyltransferase family protein [Pseudomonadota bacterium]